MTEFRPSPVGAPKAEVLARQVSDADYGTRNPRFRDVMSWRETDLLAGDVVGTGVASRHEAMLAAEKLAATGQGGIAVLQGKDGYDLIGVNVRTTSFFASTPHGTIPPMTRQVSQRFSPYSPTAFSFGQNKEFVAVMSDRLVAVISGANHVLAPTSVSGRPGKALLPADVFDH